MAKDHVFNTCSGTNGVPDFWRIIALACFYQPDCSIQVVMLKSAQKQEKVCCAAKPFSRKVILCAAPATTSVSFVAFKKLPNHPGGVHVHTAEAHQVGVVGAGVPGPGVAAMGFFLPGFQPVSRGQKAGETVFFRYKPVQVKNKNPASACRWRQQAV